MDDDVLFWKVVDSTTSLESEPDKQLAALHTALSKLSLEQIGRYESSFDSEMKRSFSWDLWALHTLFMVARRTIVSNIFGAG